MQVGVITMDGHIIGTISLTEGLSVDPLNPDMTLPKDVQRFSPLSRFHESEHHSPHHEGASLHDRAFRGRGHTGASVRDAARRGHYGASVADRARHGAHHPAASYDELRPTGPISGTLQEQRSGFAKELDENPELRTKLKRIMSNEQGTHTAGTQAVAESAMNRAIVRGTSLSEQLHWHEGGRGYYQKGSMGRGAVEHPETNAMLEQGIKNALSGADVSRGATDNASAGLAAREERSGAFATRVKIHGETFSAPAAAEPGLARKWQEWHKAVTTPKEAVKTPSNYQKAKAEPSTPSTPEDAGVMP